MCLYPKLILNRKYLPNKKNKGIVPEITDLRTKYVPIGCGKCMECRKQKKMQWQIRLQEELRTDKTGKFVTLSFSDESIIELENEVNKEAEEPLTGYELDNAIATLGTRRFLENWRSKNKTSVKHWFVTELGQTNTERIHIHGIIFTRNIKHIKLKWTYGNVWIGDYVSERTVNYIVKYISKTDIKHKEFKAIVLTSPGIGKNYINRLDSQRNKYKKKDTDETVENTPFVMITIKDETFGAFGQYRITEVYKTKEECEKELTQITWNRIIQIITLVNEMLNKKN
ncbi:MAG: replication initiator protein [Microviridae sp.]|nr:MAG: replication initiator protein [Microviridae sp.]